MLPPVERDTGHGWDRAAELEQIRSTYAEYARDGRARLWDRRGRGFAHLASELDRRLLEELHLATAGRVGHTVVDLGCGTGDLAATAGQGVDRWIGVDLRPEAIDAARAQFPNATFIVASADEVPLDDGTADVVVARLLFSSLPSGQLEVAVAREAERLLRPGGWLVWLDIRYSNPANRAVHGLPKGVVRGLFPGWRQELHSVGLLPPIARRLGPLAPVLYPLLAAMPPLRSHLVGRLQRPPRASS
jgi:SAM-dependent methyltransferase